MRPHPTTGEAYAAVAEDDARLVPDLSLEAPLDRSVLAAFVEMVEAGPVAEIGCGTGRVLSHLADAGLPVVGLDLSPGMLGVAARRGLPLAAADVRALPLQTASLGGLVAWYSLLHLPPDEIPAAAAELGRVVRPGAPVLVAFQSGDGRRVDQQQSYGRPVPLTSYRHGVEHVDDALRAAGLAPYATVLREPALSFETTPRALLLRVRA